MKDTASMDKVKNFLKIYLPKGAADALRRLRNYAEPVTSVISAASHYPLNKIRGITLAGRFYPDDSGIKNRRSFEYDRSLLPNSFLSDIENGSSDLDSAVKKGGLTPGYPACNLLYYSIVCSLSGMERESVIVETGTNLGFSTIIMAQALRDSRREGFVHTVDIDAENIALAKRNVEKAGLSEYVKFYEEDAVAFLSHFVKETPYIDFVFLDDLHEHRHIRKEFSLVYPGVLACRGKVYFDNTNKSDAAVALKFIRYAYPGNIIEFRNCSCLPPGNAIWQGR